MFSMPGMEGTRGRVPAAMTIDKVVRVYFPDCVVTSIYQGDNIRA